jgi:hypothetical protein
MRHALGIALALTALAAVRPPGALADAPAPVGGDVLARARTLIAAGEHRKAAYLLEETLPEASPKDRPALVELLRQSYRRLITQAEAEGRTAEAGAYRDDLEILSAGAQEALPARRPPARPEPLPEPRLQAPTPAGPALPAPSAAADPGLRPLPRTAIPPDATTPAGSSPASGKASIPLLTGPQEDQASAAPSEPKALPDPPGEKQTPAAEDADQPASTPPVASLPSPAPSAGPSANHGAEPDEPAPRDSDLTRADELFNARNYEEAGRSYARLAATNQLPAQRKQVWAYCRWVAVVARINAPPRDGREWDAIEQEIRSIQRLTPGNWYGEYLQNRVAEARRGGGRSQGRGRLVVRGSEPDDPAPPKRPRPLGRTGASAAETPPPAPATGPDRPLSLPPSSGEDPAPVASIPQPAADDTPSAAPAAQREPQPTAPPTGASSSGNSAPPSWQVRESANFRIFHDDQALAEKASVAAESVRSQQARRWGSSATRSTWEPKCEIYLYPTPRRFAELTGQPETSPGFSTMGLNGNRITARRVNLRADHPQLLTAILPHEVTHVVLADLFTQQQIPRWADEGMAVLAEPLAEQLSRAADLTTPLAEGRVFKLNELMAIDYPNAEAWGLYYAQSVSLTQFLVAQATPQDFVRFVRGAQRDGIEASLREVYRIDGFSELETRWQTYAKRQVAEIAAARDASNGAEAVRRR